MFDIPFSELISKEANAFYADHQHEDASTLILKYAGDPLKKAWVQQLDSRRRALKKLPTWFANSQIVFPPKTKLEQASSEVTADFKATICSYKTSLDLTAGTGIDSWQFAQYATKHTLVEPNQELLELAKHNFEVLDIHNCSFVNATAEDFIKQNQNLYDFIFVDPSRRIDSGKKVIRLEDYSPNVIAMQENLLAVAENVLVKVSPMADISYLLDAFHGHVAEVFVVAVKNEVKEILLRLQQQPAKPAPIHAVNLRPEPSIASFIRSDQSIKPELAAELHKYIYEPNAAVLKTGFFNAICSKYSLLKLDVHSHLYTQEGIVENFPGMAYELVEVAAPFKLTTRFERASIIARNFPQKPEVIRKRLKVKEGNSMRLFATTLNGKKCFILARPVR